MLSRGRYWLKRNDLDEPRLIMIRKGLETFCYVSDLSFKFSSLEWSAILRKIHVPEILIFEQQHAQETTPTLILGNYRRSEIALKDDRISASIAVGIRTDTGYGVDF